MVWRARSFWLSAGAVAYVAFAALGAGDAPSPFPSPPPTLLGRGLPWLALFGLPAALAAVWSLTEPPARGEDRVDPGARAAARACAAGAAVLLAALTGPGSPGFVALANLGAAAASMAALVALARLGSLGGMVEPPATARRLEAAAFASLLWTVAIALPAARVLAPRRTGALDPVVLDLGTATAALGSLGLCLASAFRARATRRLELGVAERASAALLLSTTALGVGVLAAAAGVASPERVLPATAVVAAVAIAASAVARDPAALPRALRVTLALAAIVAPVALGAVVVAQAAPRRAGAAVFAACVASAVAGLAAPVIARRLASGGARWLGALEAATRAAMRPDPDAALEAALGALGTAGDRGGGGAALYRLAPAEVVTVDRGGYAHVEKVELPEGLVEAADGEPERILRLEAARAVEVRRPGLRPIAAWMEQQGVAALAVVHDDLDPMGLLAIARRDDAGPTSLEEVRALRALADRLGAVIGVSASLARSRGRELEGRAESDRLAAELGRLASARDRDAGRMAALARMLERPARVASYSPAARAAVEQLERLGEAGRPIALLSAPGVDAVAWAALAHLASPRRAGPLLVIDGTSPLEHDLTRWRDAETSPLTSASGGSLVIVDAHALPLDVQSYLGAALPEGGGIVVSLPATVDALAASGRIVERLADRLGDRTVALPPLATRAEDLRALALEHLARIGIRLGRQPLGLAPRALAVLMEHEWPGNDAELYATLLRAALAAEEDVIGVKDLAKAGLGRAR